MQVARIVANQPARIAIVNRRKVDPNRRRILPPQFDTDRASALIKICERLPPFRFVGDQPTLVHCRVGQWLCACTKSTMILSFLER